MADIQSTTRTKKNTLKDKGTLPADANVNIFLVVICNRDTFKLSGTQLGLRETVSKGRDRHPYIPVGLSRPSDWLSPSPHPIAPPPLLLVE
ncbi:hypothetical protein OUZ56_014299 [Daphnia magna]|uniref:Uncharacterized protein n=1 Tax=Daphnia magna TaxID=35525 RepID=A0ABR0AJJ1_9CRUS|nr:hypothetical protein OUZ56_014299 [Daphnia magna]